MKKLITVSVFAFACSLAVLPAKADLLYFLINSFSFEGPKYNFDYAMVGVAKNVDGQWTTEWGGTGGDEQVFLKVKADGGAFGDYVDSVKYDGVYTKAGPAWADVSDYTSDDYAFYIETWKESTTGDKLIWGFDEESLKGYATLLKEGHIYTDSTAAQDVTAWSIPEPTSGLLFLLGLAGLALRRRSRGDRPTAAGCVLRRSRGDRPTAAGCLLRRSRGDRPTEA